jgi:phage tail protein X
VLVGQPELAVRLRNPSLRQFNQRVAARSVLSRLSFAEANEYVEYRLRAKGGRSKDLFDTAALTYLLRHSGGLPRKINVLCHNAMLLAYSSGKQQVDLKATRAAVAEHGEPLLGGLAALSTSAASKQPALVGIAALGLVLFTGYLYRGNPTGAVQAGSVPPAVALESRTSAKTIADKIVASFSPLHVARRVEQTNHENLAVESRPQATRRASAISAIDNAPQTAQPGITGPLVLPDLSPTDSSLDHSQSAMEHPKSAIEHEANSASQADRGSISSVSSTAVRHRSVLVKYGDTLERLAIRYLGSRYALGAIEDANPQIADVNKIYPGQKVYLSATDTSHANTDTSTEPADRVAYKH